MRNRITGADMGYGELCQRCGYQESEHKNAYIFFSNKDIREMRKRYSGICKKFISPRNNQRFRTNGNMFYFLEDIGKVN